MVMALALLFLGVPLALHMVSSWNEIAPDGSTVILGENEFNTTKWGTSQGKVCLRDGDYYTPQNTIIWGDDTASEIVIQDPGTDSTTMLYWFLNYTVSDLIHIGMDGISYNISFPNGLHAFGMFFGTTKYQDGKYVLEIKDLGWKDYEGWYWDDYDKYKNVPRSNVTGKISWTTLDLLTVKAEFGEIYPIIALYSYEGGLDTTDQVTFNMSYVRPSSVSVNNNTTLKIGGLVIGLFLIWVGVASTPLYNPAPGSKPGRIDNWISSIKIRIKRRRKKRGR